MIGTPVVAERYSQQFLLNNPTRDQVLAARNSVAKYALGDATPVQALLQKCPRYERTPLLDLPALASRFGIARLLVKDERNRLSLGSFKSLGGAHAVLRLANMRQGEATKPRPEMVFTTATAGNHGRSVAAGAAIIGARCVIFVFDGVSEARIAAIAGLGAEIVRVRGVYDDAVAACRQAAEGSGWTLVSDTSSTPTEQAPALVMQGYTVIGAELAEQADEPLTHIFVQAGVGGLAAAVAAYLDNKANPPRVVVVEPEAAPCVQESVRAARPILLDQRLRTTMGRLECFAPSVIALEILQGLGDAFLTITDEDSVREVATARAHGLSTTPSGAAGLAGLVRAARKPEIRQALQLTSRSRVALILTEAPCEGE